MINIPFCKATKPLTLVYLTTLVFAAPILKILEEKALVLTDTPKKRHLVCPPHIAGCDLDELTRFQVLNRCSIFPFENKIVSCCNL